MNDLNRILLSPNYSIEQAEGVLARLWRTILKDLQIKPSQNNMLLLIWSRDPANGIPDDGREQSTARGNLVKELARPDMSWRVFLKGIRLLAPPRIHFEVHFKWRTKPTSVHGFDVLFKDIVPLLESDESDIEDLIFRED